MAKNAFIGVGNVVRKIKQPYIGVGNAVRKVKSGFIGVNNVVRQFFPSYKLDFSYFIDGDGQYDYVILEDGFSGVEDGAWKFMVDYYGKVDSGTPVGRAIAWVEISDFSFEGKTIEIAYSCYKADVGEGYLITYYDANNTLLGYDSLNPNLTQDTRKIPTGTTRVTVGVHGGAEGSSYLTLTVSSFVIDGTEFVE